MAFSKADFYSYCDQETAKFAKAISHPARLFILGQLNSGPTNFAALFEDHPLAKPTFSRHLRVLSRAGLIIGKSHGLNTEYESILENHPIWLQSILYNRKLSYLSSKAS